MIHTLYRTENYSEAPRRSVRRACGFVLVASWEVSAHARGRPAPDGIDRALTLNSVDDTDFGYLRVVVNSTTMTIEFHPESHQARHPTPGSFVSTLFLHPSH